VALAVLLRSHWKVTSAAGEAAKEAGADETEKGAGRAFKAVVKRRKAK
jgi:hypothetical protein